MASLPVRETRNRLISLTASFFITYAAKEKKAQSGAFSFLKNYIPIKYLT